jgi:cobalt-zinc-cadmium efflux system protein
MLAWVAYFVGRFKPNARNTYGWQRASVLAAFVNAVILLLAMGALIWEAITRLQALQSTNAAVVMWVAGMGIVVNGITAMMFMKSQHSDLNIRGAFLHMMADAAISAGVVLSGLIYLYCGWQWLDPVMSMVIAIIIVAGTWGLFKQSLHLLFDGVPDHIDSLAVYNWLKNQQGVSDVHELHIWAMSTTDTALTAHLIMPGGHPGDDFLNAVAAGLHDEFHIVHPTLQIETRRVTTHCAQCSGEIHHH